MTRARVPAATAFGGIKLHHAPTHDALVGANATDDWHGHLRESLGGAVTVER